MAAKAGDDGVSVLRLYVQNATQWNLRTFYDAAVRGRFETQQCLLLGPIAGIAQKKEASSAASSCRWSRMERALSLLATAALAATLAAALTAALPATRTADRGFRAC
jgi:hypothetical protein